MSHWYKYNESGVPARYLQYKKDGTESKVIIRKKAIEDGAVESVTTILKMVGDAGGLIKWAANMGVLSGLNVGMSAASGGCSYEELLSMAKEEADARMEQASAEGTAIHDSIETYINTGVESDDPIQRTAQLDAMQWIKETCSPSLKSEHCLIFKGDVRGTPMSFGGTADLITPYQIVDFKTVETKNGKFRDPKPTECAQLAAYRLAAFHMGLCESQSDCYNVYFDRPTGRLVGSCRWTDDHLNLGLDLLSLASRVGDVMNRLVV